MSTQTELDLYINSQIDGRRAVMSQRTKNTVHIIVNSVSALLVLSLFMMAICEHFESIFLRFPSFNARIFTRFSNHTYTFCVISCTANYARVSFSDRYNALDYISHSLYILHESSAYKRTLFYNV